MSDKSRITIHGVEYIRADTAQMAESLDGMPYCIVRTYSAGVFAGYVKKREGQEVTLQEARRIWYWEGAASLSQLAQSGTSKPMKCKFPEPVSELIVTEAIEILNVTKAAKQSIAEVPVWKA